MSLTYSHVSSSWNEKTQRYEMDFAVFEQYNGPVIKACGATDEQKNIGAQQSQLFQTMADQSEQVFGKTSAIFDKIFSTFSPIVAAGINQKGMSPAQEAALKSGAITNAGIAYRNAKQAVGEAQAAIGGGNMALPSGAEIGQNAALATSAAENTANQLNLIDQRNYELGRENFMAASGVLGGAPQMFNSATNAAGAAVGAGTAAADTANQIAAANNSWMNMVGGALGGIGGAVVSGGMSNLGKGVGFFGGK